MFKRSLVALCLLAGPALAQTWPSQPVRLVVPYAAGGATDVIARVLAEGMSARLPHRILVENRTGAGGNIGAEAVARAAPDGQTLLFTNIGHAVLRAIYPRLTYDPVQDLAPISIVAESPMVLLAANRMPDTIQGFVAALRAEPGKFEYGTTGGGGALQLAALLFLRASNTQMIEVPYRGGSPATLDLAAGRIAMLYDAGLTAFATARGGQARALAVSSPRRSAVAPDVPTVAEAGFPDATMVVWQAVMAPAATPTPIQDRIAASIATTLADTELAARLAGLGAERLVGGTPAEARVYVATETARWEPIMRAAGVTAQ
ncbi:Bug family tripartite tricarboxylate transporter substrate binding protein [Humitalea sp. 24SJ18S-53]|uniref:Bug family tripartite tricarboxylate transporter substrate binding protein n=1 Tax=Humitalea sp. 24SJ18S-53 TaxID=3422307 RepID=UPI003D67867A